MNREHTSIHTGHSNFEYGFKFRKVNDRFHKLWQMKSSVRESLRDWLLASDVSPSIAEVCANACSELIENSIKYTRNESVASIAISINDTLITVETINKTEKPHLDLLCDSIRVLDTTSNPQELFINKLLDPMDRGSHLGLVKIVMETKGKIELIREQDDDLAHVKLKIHPLTFKL